MTDKRPIRRDRVLLVAVILVGIILVPLLMRSGGSVPQKESIGEQQSEEGVIQQPSSTVVPELEEPIASEGTEDISAVGERETPRIEEPVEEEQPSDLVLNHVVAAGEQLGYIASRLGVTIKAIMASNRIFSSGGIKEGQLLRVPREGILHSVKSGQTLTDIALTYGATIDEIVETNWITDPSMIYAGEEIVISHPRSLPWENVIHFSQGEEVRFIWPLFGPVVSPFGWRIHPVLGNYHHHNGIDIDVASGTTIYAAAPGKVYFVGEDNGYGTLVVLRHSDGYYTFYGHLSEALVYKGQFVEAGQPIAESGNSGISSGPHLHFEIRNHEFPLDPLRFLS
ncbi:M23 family metallopeptidase [Candidatus Bipolaricaulota bacterium]|nr:M23 family metallopeptidase [Candidatus Bipolaricaulota bacterium]